MIHRWRMRELLQSFADGELPEGRRASVARHVADCAECAASLRRLRESDQWFCAARLEPEPLSRAAAQRMLERALAHSGGSRRALGAGAPYYWAFAAALVATFGISASWWYLSAGRLMAPPPSSRIADREQPGELVNMLWSTPRQAGAPQAGKAAPKGSTKSVSPPAKKPPVVTPPADTRGSEPRPRPARSPRGRYLCETPPSGVGAPRGVELVSRSLNLNTGSNSSNNNSTSVDVDLVSRSLGPADRGAGDAAMMSSLPPGELLVVVTDDPAPSPVIVTTASEEAPGFARASALRPDGLGGWMWAQSTISTECAGPEQSLVMLGSDLWNWEEVEDERVLGEDEDEDEDRGSAAAGSGDEPAGDEGDGTVAEQTDAGPDSPAGPGDGEGESPEDA